MSIPLRGRTGAEIRHHANLPDQCYNLNQGPLRPANFSQATPTAAGYPGGGQNQQQGRKPNSHGSRPTACILTKHPGTRQVTTTVARGPGGGVKPKVTPGTLELGK